MYIYIYSPGSEPISGYTGQLTLPHFGLVRHPFVYWRCNFGTWFCCVCDQAGVTPCKSDMGTTTLVDQRFLELMSPGENNIEDPETDEGAVFSAPVL